MTDPTPIRKPTTERVYVMSSGLRVRLIERHEKMSNVMPTLPKSLQDKTMPVREVVFDLAASATLDSFEAQTLCHLITAWMLGAPQPMRGFGQVPPHLRGFGVIGEPSEELEPM